MKLWKNIRHLTDGLRELGLDIGATESAIIPVKIGDIAKTLEAGKLLLRAGIFANPIMYPAVAKKDARIRLNVMATHTTEQLDKVLEAFSDVKRRLNS
ncbi:aminotransferase class I/II-fold pyridoxal phosphate-dependent enzyme [Parapedobacter soli]|uniref:aminotransferase class I/II-fold pyridoxal phosphate-dependent enzyme n=1 Tax=Parapedobacter soli TaxID=416955 RepID=UPI0021C5C8A3